MIAETEKKEILKTLNELGRTHGVQKTGESRQKQNNAAQGAGTREPIQLRLFKEF